MSSYFQQTLAAPVTFTGIGIHTGQPVTVSIHPAAPGAGIVFQRVDVSDRDNRIPAKPEAVCQTRLGTVIGNAAGVTVSTVEHLMAVFCALELDNLLVELDGPEVPIMDGSAAPFVEALDVVGRQRQDAPRRHIEILRTIEVLEDDKRAALEPAERFEVAFEILFDSPAIGRQRVELTVDEAGFRDGLAGARTFGFLREFDQLRAAGLARGASLENAVAVDQDGVMNPEGLRRPDEFVRHKALDAVGDLYLLGPIIGRYEGLYSGHGLNNALVRALLAQPDAWRFVTRAPELAAAV